MQNQRPHPLKPHICPHTRQACNADHAPPVDPVSRDAATDELADLVRSLRRDFRYEAGYESLAQEVF